MRIEKSDIIQTRDSKDHTYKYSHAEEISIGGDIWIRHIWNLEIPEGHWKPHKETRLMKFEPTSRRKVGDTP